MLPAGFELAIPTSDWMQTYALDSAATGSDLAFSILFDVTQ